MKPSKRLKQALKDISISPMEMRKRQEWNKTCLWHIDRSEPNRAERRAAFRKSNLFRLKVSPWIVVQGYCATRVIEGTDPSRVENRVAFIEKSPRILVNGNWIYGPKGCGGHDGHIAKNELYGFYPPSRKWCDEMLVKHGAILG